MKNYLMGKWFSMAGRERALTAMAALIAAVALADVAVYEPVAGALDAVRKDLDLRKGEFALAAKQRVDLSAELDALSTRGSTSGPTSVFADARAGGGLWSEAQAALWVARTQKAFGEDLGRLSVVSSGSMEAGYRGVYAHAVGLEAVSSWDRVSAYMEEAKTLRALRVERMDVIALQNGQVKLDLRFRVLSGERVWQDVGPASTVAEDLK